LIFNFSPVPLRRFLSRIAAHSSHPFAASMACQL
jgi:hypothetical protein